MGQGQRTEDQWDIRPMGQGQRTYGTMGPYDLWTEDQWDIRSYGTEDQWDIRPMGQRTNGT